MSGRACPAVQFMNLCCPSRQTSCPRALGHPNFPALHPYSIFISPCFRRLSSCFHRTWCIYVSGYATVCVMRNVQLFYAFLLNFFLLFSQDTHISSRRRRRMKKKKKTDKKHASCANALASSMTELYVEFGHINLVA